MANAPSESLAAADKKKSSSSRVTQMLMTLVWVVGAQFVAAGRWDWTRGWICVVVWIVPMTILGLIAQRYNPQLMKERAKWRRKDTKPFDKVFMSLYLPCIILQPVVAGFDAVRYHWSSIPFGFVYPGILLFLLATGLVGWVLCINPFAETTVRIQSDRGHTVIATGPYHFVRHPMYIGTILMNVATPLIWGSVWALVVAGVTAVLFVARTAFEDRTLRRELTGYEDYADRTRYRLLPGIW